MTTDNHGHLALVGPSGPKGQTHRVTVENLTNHSTLVLAAGDEVFCRTYAEKWLRDHQLRPLHNLHITRILSTQHGPPPETLEGPT